MIPIPDDDRLIALGSQAFANEVKLQRFFEDQIAPLCGFRLVSSSLRGRGRIGFIDSLAIDERGTPVVIEYKRDVIDGDAVTQLVRYERWFLEHRAQFDSRALAKWNEHPSSNAQPRLVAVGYRFHRSAVVPDCEVVFLRYRYRSDGTIALQTLSRDDITQQSMGDPPPVFSKDGALDGHLAKTTPAAAEAFQSLRRHLDGAGLTEKIHGKNRVGYRRNYRRVIELTFTPVAVQCFFRSDAPPADPEGRAQSTTKSGFEWTCGLVSTADVDPVLLLLGLPSESGE